MLSVITSFQSVLKKAKKLLKEMVGDQPLDQVAAELYVKRCPKRVRLVAEAITKLKAAKPDATDTEIASVAIVRFLRHVL